MKGNLILTIILALFMMGIVIAGLAIGLILTGKSRLRKGCGLTPKKGKHKNTRDESTCSLCGNKQECEKEDDECS